MANTDIIKPSYDALATLEQAIRAISYAASLVPDEDDHSALFSVLANKAEIDFDVLRREVIKLWPEPALSSPSVSPVA
ncbi:hypothetical protein [Providencia huaxiensis]|uniref:hypothetical protein n=1 Tax=Providencia huaxiensis TaxID=2027290 RepID=UPI0030CC67CA